MKEIKLNNSELVAIVDDEMYNVLNKEEWRATQAWGNSWRAMTGHDTYMHHLVIGFPPRGMVVDHIDGNGLNNQRANLRFVTKSENAFNSKLRTDNKTGVRGVSPRPNGKYLAHYTRSGKTFWLGHHDTVEAATKAREDFMNSIKTSL